MQKRVPERMCVVCRKRAPKLDMIRVVKQDDNIVIDDTGKMNGRGAYICKNSECLQKCVKTKSFNRSYKRNLPNDIYESIQNKIGK